MCDLQDDIARGCLENGEPIEARWGTGWWSQSHEPYPEPDICPCPVCGETAYDMGLYADCPECGKRNTDGSKYESPPPAKDEAGNDLPF